MGFTSLLENENRNKANHLLMCRFFQNEFWVINQRKIYHHFRSTHNITLDNDTFLLAPNKYICVRGNFPNRFFC